MIEWREISIEEIAAPDRYSVVGGPFGSALGRKDYVTEGVPVIRGSQLGGPGSFSHDDLVFVTDAKADHQRGNLAFPGDVIVTQRGTVGQVGRIPDVAPYQRYLLSQSQMKLTVDRSKANPDFVYYALLAPCVQHQLRSSTVSAGVPHINLATFRQIRLTAPALPEQTMVASILRGIDDLIENNRMRIEVLEKMAQAIYREWFVRFRYPGHEDANFVDSPLGPIPAGWVVGSVEQLAESVVRGVAPRYDDNGPWTVLNQRCIRDRRVTMSIARRQSRDVPRAKQVLAGDVLVNSTGVGTLGRVALQLEEHPHLTADSHVTIVRPGEPDANPWFGMSLLDRQPDFEALGTGTTGQTELSRHDVGALQLLCPPLAIRQAFAESVWVLLRATPSLLSQSRALASIRDLLLPKLVTGQIDVSNLDLDELVGSVA